MFKLHKVIAVLIEGGEMNQVVASHTNTSKPYFPTSLTPDQLKQAVQVEVARRGIIKEFVKSQLEQNKDYGTIGVQSRTGVVTQSKPTLFKSGMEKIFSLFNVVSTLEKDSQTIEMVGKPGVIAYKCTLIRSGEFIGEGRGAAEVSEKGRVNDAIKIAEKRARMDACLNLGFSEYFTQDLDDALPEDSTKEGDLSNFVQPVPAPSKLQWHHGEVQDLTFRVEDKELKQSQTGTIYALLSTSYGVIKAWKNTQERFKIGATYKAAIEATSWNGDISLSVVRIHEKIPVTPSSDDISAQVQPTITV